MTSPQRRAPEKNCTRASCKTRGVNRHTNTAVSTTSRHTAVSTAFVPRGVYTAIAGHAVSSIRHSSSQMFLLFLTRCACEWPCACQSHEEDRRKRCLPHIGKRERALFDPYADCQLMSDDLRQSSWSKKLRWESQQDLVGTFARYGCCLLVDSTLLDSTLQEA